MTATDSVEACLKKAFTFFRLASFKNTIFALLPRMNAMPHSRLRQCPPRASPWARSSPSHWDFGPSSRVFRSSPAEFLSLSPRQVTIRLRSFLLEIDLPRAPQFSIKKFAMFFARSRRLTSSTYFLANFRVICLSERPIVFILVLLIDC